MRIFVIYFLIQTIESKETSSDSDGAVQVSQLNLVDLAGSERANSTGAIGERFKEGTHINRSLSTLGLVIKQLSEAQQSHVNFRDSKLTRILQASLGGNAMTTIICAVTPASLDETQSTLAYVAYIHYKTDILHADEDLKLLFQVRLESQKCVQQAADQWSHVRWSPIETI